jgi:hypothetical protein
MNLSSLAIYREAMGGVDGLVSESPAPFENRSELEWQARWFAGEFGRQWLSTDGKEIVIEDFGKWNRESGPDFVEVRLRIGGREVIGAIELDTDARDWERHGHGSNPAFRETVLHVFLHTPTQRFFTRTCDHREVAQLHLPSNGKTSVPLPPAPPLLSQERARAMAILHTAALHRLDLKARAWQRHASVHGEDHAWFAALAVALGYKSNQTPFLLLAQRTGLAAASSPRGEATLFGTAGFLEAPLPTAPDRAVRDYLRELWEVWWALRADCERLILSPGAWKIHGIRPANHPHRRVAALRQIAANWLPIRTALASSHREGLVTALEALTHPFWNARFNLQAAPLARPQALIGADRIRDIVINLHHPLAVAKDATAWAGFLDEKGPPPNATLKNAARKFFGAMAGAKGFLSTSAAQQGLLQLERDYRSVASPGEFLSALRKISEGSTVANSPC